MSKVRIVGEIIRLSQEYGYTDAEIADRLGYARGSINRIRRENSIPKYNLEKRKERTSLGKE